MEPRPKKPVLSFHPCLVTECQVILGSRAMGPSDLELMARARAILLPQTCPEELYAAATRACGLVFPFYGPRFLYKGKTGQARMFREHGLPHPETTVWPSASAFEEAVGSRGGLPHEPPFLLKTDMDHEGDGIRVVRGPADLGPALGHVRRCSSPGGQGFLSQAVVPADGNVLRAVLLGRSVRTYWKRLPGEGVRVSTISRGARIDFDWRKDLQAKGRSLAREVRERLGINLAAVDMVFPMSRPDPEPLILEINYSFGRRGLGGSEAYYGLLFEAVREWLLENGLDPGAVTLA